MFVRRKPVLLVYLEYVIVFKKHNIKLYALITFNMFSPFFKTLLSKFLHNKKRKWEEKKENSMRVRRTIVHVEERVNKLKIARNHKKL